MTNYFIIINNVFARDQVSAQRRRARARFAKSLLYSEFATSKVEKEMLAFD